MTPERSALIEAVPAAAPAAPPALARGTSARARADGALSATCPAGGALSSTCPPGGRRPSALALWLLVGVLLVGSGRSAWAAGLPGRLDREALRLRSRGARVERGAGLGLATLGLAAMIIGGVLLGVSGQASYQQGARYQDAGVFLVITGAVAFVPGVALAIHGQDRLNDVNWRLRLLSGVALAPAPHGLVASLQLRF